MQGQNNIMLCQLLVYSQLYLHNLCLVLLVIILCMN